MSIDEAIGRLKIFEERLKSKKEIRVDSQESLMFTRHEGQGKPFRERCPGLVGYYRRFVQGYATMAAPLTNLLRKDGFKWDVEASAAFEALKRQLSTAPILGHPDFEQPFIVETDASVDGMGVVLIQDDRPICYFSLCDVREVLKNGEPTRQVLVQWVEGSPEEATWEWLSEFQKAYPNYNLEDKVAFEDRRNDTPTVKTRGRTARIKKVPGWQRDFVMG
ncbi:ty3-gypsy retrotransposon protein [Tanacetum coccineum]